MAREVDPRIERTRRVVLQASIEQLAAVGYGGFTVDGVAARSGVARSTIYRHWPDKLALVADAFEVLNVQPRTRPDVDGPPRERIRTLIVHLAEVWRDSSFSACVPALIDGAERDAALRRFLHRYSARRRRALVRAIADAVEAGDVSRDVDPELAAVALSGAILYLRTMAPRRFNPNRADELVDLVLGPSPSTRPS